MDNRHILVVDDDPKIRALLRSCFEGEGAIVEEATGLESVLRAFAHHVPDLVTLDLGLEGDSGLDIARELRKSHDTPIIMVTARDDVIDRVVGLELGADDYVTKPFHIREMLARANSVLRRYEAPARMRAADPAAKAEGGGEIMLDGLRIDRARMIVRDRGGHDCNLTGADFKLLGAFLDHSGRPLSRDRLMDLIEGPSWVPMDRTIDNQVARLRKKIERDPASPRLIKTVRGIGYMLTEAAEACGQPGLSTA